MREKVERWYNLHNFPDKLLWEGQRDDLLECISFGFGVWSMDRYQRKTELPSQLHQERGNLVESYSLSWSRVRTRWESSNSLDCNAGIDWGGGGRGERDSRQRKRKSGERVWEEFLARFPW